MQPDSVFCFGLSRPPQNRFCFNVLKPGVVLLQPVWGFVSILKIRFVLELFKPHNQNMLLFGFLNPKTRWGYYFWWFPNRFWFLYFCFERVVSCLGPLKTQNRSLYLFVDS